jgi:hypothetical protein
LRACLLDHKLAALVSDELWLELASTGFQLPLLPLLPLVPLLALPCPPLHGASGGLPLDLHRDIAITSPSFLTTITAFA